MLLNNIHGDKIVKFACELFEKRLQKRNVRLPEDFVLETELSNSLAEEEYEISDRYKDGLKISGGSSRAVLYGFGKLLRNGSYLKGVFTPGPWRGKTTPEKPYRIIYLASHFFNVFHVGPKEFLFDYIADLAFAGYNYLSLTIQMHTRNGLDDPAYQKDVDRIHKIYEFGMKVGMKCHIGIYNGGFFNTPQNLRAEPTGRSFFGTEICPSNPEGLELIKKIAEHRFEAFKDLDVGMVDFWSYDQGGCGCEKCRPYGYNGMLKVINAIKPLAEKYWKKAKFIQTTWLFQEDEFDGLYKKFENNSPAKSDIIMADSHEDFPKYILEHGLPKNTELITFPEISMWGRCPWGGFGATPLPKRFSRLFGQVQHLSAGGRLYCEGIYEDFNKMLYSNFFWSGNNEIDLTIKEYANYEFGLADPEPLQEVLNMMENNHYGIFWDPACGNGKTYPRALIGKKGINANTCYWKPDNCDKLLDKLKMMDCKLPDWGRDSWRWRLFMLRGIIDAELARNNGNPGPECETAFKELSQLYYTCHETTPRCAPYTNEWIKAQNFPEKAEVNENDKVNTPLGTTD